MDKGEDEGDQRDKGRSDTTLRCLTGLSLLQNQVLKPRGCQTNLDSLRAQLSRAQ